VKYKNKEEKLGKNMKAIKSRKSFFLVLTICFYFLFFGCYSSSSISKVHDSTEQNANSQINSPEYHLLDSAFRDSSREGRRAFFNGWLHESDSLRSLKYPEDSIRQMISELFVDIYKPDTTSFQDFIEQTRKMPKDQNDGMDGDKLINFARNTTGFYRDAKFIVVQSVVPFLIYSDNDFAKLAGSFSSNDKVNQIKKDSVTDFAPIVSYYDKQVLILTKKYEDILNEYLLNSIFGNKKKFDEADFRLVHTKRAFLLPGIEIATEHWGNGWHYITFPEVFNIQFNQSFSKAIINFRSAWNGGGDAKYEKQNGKWIQKEYSPNTWIE
jgi:hypothetical protein